MKSLRTFAERGRWAIPLLAAVAVAVADRHAYLFDTIVFTTAGRTFLSSNWANAFADPSVQSGPLQLLFYGAGSRLADILPVSHTLLLGILVQTSVVAAAITATGMALKERPARKLWQFFVGMLVVVLAISHEVFVKGHPAEVFIPALWIAAAVLVRRGKPVAAGALIGLSAGWELWGVLGTPIALLDPEPRKLLKSWGTEIAVVAAMFVPFFVFGTVRIFEQRWFVTPQSPLHSYLGVDVGTHFSWKWRLVQGVIAAGAGTAAAFVARRSPHAVWEVPAVIVGARLLFDPYNFTYYWLALFFLALIAAAEILSGPETSER